jgi:hypothetical protein
MERTKGFIYKGHIYVLVETPKGKLCRLCAFKDLTSPCADSHCSKETHYIKK